MVFHLQYEKAASILSNHDPPIILAKVDADDEINKGLAGEFKVRGFPTIKILRDGGKSVQEYKGPRNADGIVEYLKKQVGPASYEIKSSEDAGNLITEQKIFVVSAQLSLFYLVLFVNIFSLCWFLGSSDIAELHIGWGFLGTLRRRICKLHNIS